MTTHQEVKSECGHPQQQPTDLEIRNCPEIIVRLCAACGRELWWHVDTWRSL